MARKFYDFEHDCVVTEEELWHEYHGNKLCGFTEAKSFGEYIANCTSGNGILIEIR